MAAGDDNDNDESALVQALTSKLEQVSVLMYGAPRASLMSPSGGFDGWGLIFAQFSHSCKGYYNLLHCQMI